jgi:hypothetical protein
MLHGRAVGAPGPPDSLRRLGQAFALLYRFSLVGTGFEELFERGQEGQESQKVIAIGLSETPKKRIEVSSNGRKKQPVSTEWTFRLKQH